ncbi:TetR/AcrR family transcriptional regulator [Bowmanella sp. Y26]|uniref:TetR/AcrR family transcriptional regulator n=1 Tax=Bowmanella yangjiangensis TaxID=2811230 RepID=UPI001BDD4CB8|nr:TetR/AcrR family transcriptional regulator [Bowmanella yangjiangensis]MBT1065015.1 TetR/AcrR family transcriptional regulator [Bowmanella yangjiangensis]
MAWQKSHKEQTRERILVSAAKLFTEYGFEQVSIDQVMTDAKLTRGAFYAHFGSKSALYSEAILTAAKNSISRLPPQPSHTQLTEGYLSEEHVKGQGRRCPLAFLVTDISQRDETVRDTYTRMFQGMVNMLESGGLCREKALQQAVLMVGGVAIGRALNNESLVEEILSSCRNLSSV